MVSKIWLGHSGGCWLLFHPVFQWTVSVFQWDLFNAPFHISTLTSSHLWAATESSGWSLAMLFSAIFPNIFFPVDQCVLQQPQTSPTGRVWLCEMSSPWAWTPINLPGIPNFSSRALPNGGNNSPCLILWLLSCSVHGVINCKVRSKEINFTGLFGKSLIRKMSLVVSAHMASINALLSKINTTWGKLGSISAQKR